jgi:hypothetical protein
MGVEKQAKRLICVLCVAVCGLAVWNLVICQALSRQEASLAAAEQRVADLEKLLELPDLAADESGNESGNPESEPGESVEEEVQVAMEDVLAGHLSLIRDLQDNQQAIAQWLVLISAELASQKEMRQKGQAAPGKGI